MILAAVTLC